MEAPVPDRATERLESVALEERLSAPLAAPAELAVKPTLMVRLCPAARVCGLKPLIVNPVPLTAACVTLTLDPPVFVTVTDCVWLLPTDMLPKFRLAGEGVRYPAEVPVPDRATERFESVAVEEKLSAPFEVPAEAALKPTLRVRLWPTAKICGLKPLMVNPVPLTAAWVIPTLDPPVLVTVTDCVCLLPTAMLPKFTLAGEGVR